MAKAEPPAEKVRVRKIDNGFLVTRAGVTPRGKVYHREEYSADRPGAKAAPASAAKGKPVLREIGFLNRRK